MKKWFDFAPAEYHFPELKNLQVNAIEQDSRKVKPGAAFFAVPGELADGRQFIESALKNGATIVLFEAEQPSFEKKQHAFFLGIPNLKDQLGVWASAFYDDPSKNMTVIAVTGTNGKTSCTQLIAGALQQLDLPCGVMGTLGNGVYGQLTPSPNTTPDAFIMQAEFSRWREQGIRYAAIEASSHGLVLGRMQGTHIHTAAITNITRDHLDFHITMENYVEAKKSLFRWPGIQAAVINIDDVLCAPFCDVLGEAVALYPVGSAARAKVRAKSVKLTAAGLVLQVETPYGDEQLNSQLYGRFNAENLLIALACLLSISIPLQDAVRALSRVKPVPGRMQKVDAGLANLPGVVVDYAHTPDALE
ncbi:MAG TPA: UDP-N-acetylmuramoyl-L-alanyl-D-glutamate--2,6-diaminopimelate ligase, partial [Pseudomonadales bacterium]|nr:UDP-N-acetylmuramoyl-L-alanyl-D-glutamate--2,6-diaminopimelate ligase [Pseudomonadales bacterium]